MTSTLDAASSSNSRPGWGWSWVWLILAIVVVVVIRVPLVLNAEAHLDSDLAVDGLTLIDAVNGHWRWHYPATPFIGSPPVLLSIIQAKVWGPTPITLVSGGIVAYGLIVVATFLLNRRAFGPSVASWGLIPLAFASTGTLWLSGRVTGGHLLTTAWHAGAFALFWDVLVKGGWRRSASLGLWCGLGLYIDSMFAVTWVGLGVSLVVWAFSASLSPRERAGVRVVAQPMGSQTSDLNTAGDATTLTPGPSPGGRGEKVEASKANRFVNGFGCLLVFGLAAGLGVVPRFIGKWVDPHDAYVGQFDPITRLELVARNAEILALDCGPRLIAGHRLPRLQAEPDPASLPGGSRVSLEKKIPWLGLSVTIVSLGLFAWSMMALVLADRSVVGQAVTLAPALSRGVREAEIRTIKTDHARLATRWGLLASSLAVVAGFLVHPTITNSDNYRYLVFWLVPWSTGFGLLMKWVASKRPGGVWLAGVLALGFAALMTADSVEWCKRFGWVDPTGRPIRKVIPDPVRDWLDDRLWISTIYGDYWDVYRLSFLTGGRLRGVPFGEYPQRFPEITANLDQAPKRVIIVRPGRVGPTYRARAMAQGAREIGRGDGFSIVQWPEGMRP